MKLNQITPTNSKLTYVLTTGLRVEATAPCCLWDVIHKDGI